jgi:hypothetical protein
VQGRFDREGMTDPQVVELKIRRRGMAEQDPREYRGGVKEPDEAKGGPDSWADNEGVVPREMIDDPPPQETSDPQTLKDASLGEVTDQEHTDEAIDKSAGDEADATTHGGTGTGVEDVEEDKPISRVDAPNLRAQTDDP